MFYGLRYSAFTVVFEMHSPNGDFITKPASTSVGKQLPPKYFPHKTKILFATTYKFLFNKKEKQKPITQKICSPKKPRCILLLHIHFYSMKKETISELQM